MKQIRRLLTIVFLCLLPLTLAAQTYKELWNEVEGFAKKDLPKSQIEVLDKIIAKAEKERVYGQLLSGELVKYSALWRISGDSIKALKNLFRKKAEINRKRNPALSAIYYTILKDSAKALMNRNALAKYQDFSYFPLIEVGVSSDIFNHDLLHVISFQFKDYVNAANFYRKVGNRRAALVFDGYEAIRLHDISKIDSLIRVNSDLEESVWLAGERAKKYTSYLDKDNYVDSLLKVHPNSIYSNTLRNYIADNSFPYACLRFPKPVISPKDSICFDVEIRNVKELCVQVRPFINDTVVADKVVMEKIISFKPQYLCEEVISKGILSPLPVGKYEISAIADGYQESIAKYELIVSNLFLLIQGTPNDKYRLAVVDRKSGTPIPYAKVNAFVERKNNKDELYASYQCDKYGEVVVEQKGISSFDIKYAPICGNDSFIKPDRIHACFFKDSRFKYQCSLMADKCLYRPGQILHATSTLFCKDAREGLKVVQDMYLGFKINNVDTVIFAKTDEFGTASIDYTIPKDAKSGDWSIEVVSVSPEKAKVNNEKSVVFSLGFHFSVIDYKRPTVKVEWIEPKEAYKADDTIFLQGKVTSLIGTPIQNAYVIISGDIPNDTLFTNEKGIYQLKVFLKKPKYDHQDLEISAHVSDRNGESNKAKIRIYNDKFKGYFVNYDLLKKYEVTDTLQVRYNLENHSYQALPGVIKCHVEGFNNFFTVKANEDTKISTRALGLHTGEYKLVGIYKTDTLLTKFKVIDFKDKKLATRTPIWAYADHNEFRSGKDKVRIQFGTCEKDATIFYTLMTPDSVLERGQLKMSDELRVKELKYKKEYKEVVNLTFSMVKDEKLYQQDLDVKGPLLYRSPLFVSWKTFRNKLQPGAKETWQMNVRYADGKPAKAQLTATMFDATLNLLRDPYKMNYDLYLFASDISCAWESFSYRPSYKWLYHYPYNLNEYPFKVSSLRKSLLIGCANDDDIEYILHQSAYSNIKDKVLRKNFEDSSLQDTVKTLRKTKVYTGLRERWRHVKDRIKAFDTTLLSVDSYPSVDAQMESTNPLLVPGNIRKNFDEQVFWKTNLVTDSKGNIPLQFTLPDDVTSWNFYGWLHDKHMSVGKAYATIHAMKSLIVRPNIPEVLRKGDKVVIPTSIYNNSEEVQSGEVTLQLLNPETEELLYEEKKNFSVNANASSRISFSLDLSNEGELYNKVGKRVICKITAESNEGSADGEQNYLSF